MLKILILMLHAFFIGWSVVVFLSFDTEVLLAMRPSYVSLVPVVLFLNFVFALYVFYAPKLFALHKSHFLLDDAIEDVSNEASFLQKLLLFVFTVLIVFLFFSLGINARATYFFSRNFPISHVENFLHYSMWGHGVIFTLLIRLFIPELRNQQQNS